MNLGFLIDNAVARHGERIAVSSDTRAYTYRALSERTNRVGNALMGLGIGHQGRIASLQFNSIETIELDLAAARFGFVRTLLNARGSVDDHLHVLNDSAATALIFGAEFADHVATMRDRLPCIGIFVCVGDSPPWAVNYEEALARAAGTGPAHEVRESDWHSIYYTSGTTGRPKGVVLSQRNWLVLVRNHLIDVFPDASPEDVLLHAAPMSHASGTMIFAHLVRGARQHVQRRFRAEETLELFGRERVTTLFLAPTMIIKLLELDKGDHRGWRLHTVRYGGAPMSVERIREALDRWGTVFTQGFGQWEAPQMLTVLDQRQHRAALRKGNEHRMRSCGLPLTYVRVGVMNDRNELLPVGKEGEIVTAGDHLMVGYLNRPDETAQLRHGEWQRTGDVGRIDEDGFVYLTDRKKDLIITGGNNVYPREIEEVVHAHPDIEEAVAVGVPDGTWGETVHVVAVLRPGRMLDAHGFLTWCRARCSSDKRPRSVEFVSELPKNAYGKILRGIVRSRYWTTQDRRI